MSWSRKAAASDVIIFAHGSVACSRPVCTFGGIGVNLGPSLASRRAWSLAGISLALPRSRSADRLGQVLPRLLYLAAFARFAWLGQPWSQTSREAKPAQDNPALCLQQIPPTLTGCAMPPVPGESNCTGRTTGQVKGGSRGAGGQGRRPHAYVGDRANW